MYINMIDSCKCVTGQGDYGASLFVAVFGARQERAQVLRLRVRAVVLQLTDRIHTHTHTHTHTDTDTHTHTHTRGGLGWRGSG